MARLRNLDAGADALLRRARKRAGTTGAQSDPLWMTTKRPAPETGIIGADRLILVAAFRYALGRQSYMVDHVASFIEKNADKLSADDRRLIVREIDGQRESGSLGMNCDERRWMRVRERMEHAGA